MHNHETYCISITYVSDVLRRHGRRGDGRLTLHYWLFVASGVVDSGGKCDAGGSAAAAGGAAKS